MTRQKIKDAALALFVKDGYEGASISEITKTVKIKPASLYSHFESKEKLFLEIFHDLLHAKLNNIDRLKEQIAEKEAKEQLFILFNNYYEWIHKDKYEMIFWKRTALFPPSFLREITHEELINYETKYVNTLLKPIFSKGVKLGSLRNQDVDNFVVAFLNLMNSVFSEMYYSTSEVYQRKVKILWENFWYFVKK